MKLLETDKEAIYWRQNIPWNRKSSKRTSLSKSEQPRKSGNNKRPNLSVLSQFKLSRSWRIASGTNNLHKHMAIQVYLAFPADIKPRSISKT